MAKFQSSNINKSKMITKYPVNITHLSAGTDEKYKGSKVPLASDAELNFFPPVRAYQNINTFGKLYKH